jgi:response regulator RpfG family c-di-GMP phosphodiesterase
MKSLTSVLVIDGHTHRRDTMAFALNAHSGYRVETASDVADGWRTLDHGRITIVVCDEGVNGADGLALLNRKRELPNEEMLAFILLSAPESHGIRSMAWEMDIDAVLTHPVDQAELAACVRACERRVADARDLQSANDHRVVLAEQLTELLVTLQDSIHPGSRARGETLGELASVVATELDVPVVMHMDMVRAARLHEVGRLTLPTEPLGSAQIPAASARVLGRIPFLTETAELIDGMAANWDGSGIPVGTAAGQIPLRSRILRTANDLLRQELNVNILNTGENHQKVWSYSGTYYDPVVVSALELIVSRGPDALSGLHVEAIRVDHLTEGLMLDTDLHTASGVKLLSAGTVLTPTTLRLIRERHATDPIVHGVLTRRHIQ